MSRNSTGDSGGPGDQDSTMKVEEAMRELKYIDRKSFLAMAKSKGVPLIYLNTRVIRIPRAKFRKWLDDRAA